MDANPPVGVVLHAIGGLASAVFYLPYRRVKHWAWESYWLAGGVFSWIVAPWLIASIAVPDLLTVLRDAPTRSALSHFSARCGVWRRTFGLTFATSAALGTAMALGCARPLARCFPDCQRGVCGVSERLASSSWPA
jgi:L-rhamnose-H+ transport protein